MLPCEVIYLYFWLDTLKHFLLYFFPITIQSSYMPPCTVITTLLSMSMSPFPFLLNSSPPQCPPPHHLAVILLSMSLSLFCLLVWFVHQIPHRSVIIEYLSFSDWLISLSIMFSRSIHTVAKSTIFFCFYGQVVFHCVNVPQLFYSLKH